MPPSVSIIMRAKNEMPYAEGALVMLGKQTYSDYTLHAIDSGSTDGTVQALERSGAKLKQINPKAYVPGKVLNDAISATDAEIIVLLNADAIPLSEDWLEQLILPIIGNKADATFSKQVARPDAKFIVKYDYERGYKAGNVAPDFFSAVACAFKRELWEKHPFPESGYAEDARWATTHSAEGARFQLLENCAVEHSHNYTMEQLFLKRYRQALTSNEVPNIGKQIASCIREVIRDLLYALSRLRPDSIPYNAAYRIRIHRAVYSGLKAKRD